MAQGRNGGTGGVDGPCVSQRKTAAKQFVLSSRTSQDRLECSLPLTLAA